MGIELKPNLQSSKCHGYKWDGEFILFRKGVLGTLNPEQVERLCTPPHETKPLTDAMKARFEALEGVRTLPCLRATTKNLLIEALRKAQKKPDPQQLDAIRREVLAVPDCPVTPEED